MVPQRNSGVEIVTTSAVAFNFSPTAGSMPITSAPVISQPSVLVSGFSPSIWMAQTSSNMEK